MQGLARWRLTPYSRPRCAQPSRAAGSGVPFQALAISCKSAMTSEIPTVPPGSISTEQDGENLFLLLHGHRIAKRKMKARKWIPLMPWIESVSKDSDSSIVIHLAPDNVGTA